MGNDELKRRPEDELSDGDLKLESDQRPREQLLAKLVTGQTIAVAFLTLMTAIGGLLNPSSGLLNLLPLGGIAVAVGLVSYWLLWRQQFRLGGYLFLIGTSAAITANVSIRGYHDASAIYYLWPIVGAAMVLEAQDGLLVAIISTISYLVLVAVQRLGYQVPPFPYDPQGEALLTVGSRVIMFFLLAFLAWLTSQNLGRALRQARQAARGWRELNETLEQRIAERTEELSQRAGELEASNRQNQRRATQLEASAQIARTVAQVLDPDQLLNQVVHLISEHFGHYHTGIFTLDRTGRWAELQAANSEGGQRMLARGHRLAVGAQGVVGFVTNTSQPRVAHNVGADAIYFDNPDLPDTRSEFALPLIARGQIIGALDVQSTQEDAFDADEVAMLSALADQIAAALDNARLYEASQAALAQVQVVQRQYLSEAWNQYSARREADFYEYRASKQVTSEQMRGPESAEGQGVTAGGDGDLHVADQVLNKGATAIATGDADAGHAAAVVAPIKVRDQIIGALGLQGADAGHAWGADEIALIETVADQVAQAMEAARLLDQTQRRARREQLVTEIADKIRAAPDIDGILRTTVQEIRRALGVSHGVIRLGTETHLRPPEDSGLETRDSEGEH
jgi:GAF domain-containing protein